jgi:hypothetical protein
MVCRTSGAALNHDPGIPPDARRHAEDRAIDPKTHEYQQIYLGSMPVSGFSTPDYAQIDCSVCTSSTSMAVSLSAVNTNEVFPDGTSVATDI